MVKTMGYGEELAIKIQKPDCMTHVSDNRDYTAKIQ